MPGKRGISSEDVVSNRGNKKAKTTPIDKQKPETHLLQVSKEDLDFGKALRLLVFNYKGGCGKSTIVANLGASLAWSKKKVLLIDGDAQCNLTSFYKGNDNANIITEADYSDIIIESVLNHMKGSEGRILSDDLSDDVHASDMKAYISELERPALYRIFDAFFAQSEKSQVRQIVRDPTSFSCCNPDSYGSQYGLWLLEGSPLLAKFEKSLSLELMKDRYGHRGLGLMNYIMNECERAYGFDVIIMDVNPGNSLFNQFSAAACDYILAPGQASLYSCASVHGLLSTVLSGTDGWLNKFAELSKQQWEPSYLRDDKDLENWRFPKDPLKVLPFLINNYPLDEHQKMTRDCSQFFYTMVSYIEKNFANEDLSPKPEILVDPAGRKVIPFLPQLTAVSTLEALGRAFAEANQDDLNDYYRLKDGTKTRTDQELLQFENEVKIGKARFDSLAAWIRQLMDEKKSKNCGTSSSSTLKENNSSNTIKNSLVNNETSTRISSSSSQSSTKNFNFNTPWICPRCTFENVVGSKNCDMCKWKF